MLEQTRRGLAVAGASAKVLAQHPKLLALPILGLTASLVAVSFFGVGMSLGEAAHSNGIFFALGYIGVVAALGSIGAFFNAALVLCVLDGFAGREVSLRRGLAGAVSRLPQLFAWVLFSTVVGFALSTVQGLLRKLGFLGAIFGSALSMSWSVITFFVIPVLVAEDVGPIAAFERSKDLVKRNWGKAVGVETGFVLLFLLALVPIFFLIWFVNADSSAAHMPKLVLGGGAALVYFLALLAVLSTLSGVFRASLYVYATTGKVPLAVEPDLLEKAFRKG